MLDLSLGATLKLMRQCNHISKFEVARLIQEYIVAPKNFQSIELETDCKKTPPKKLTVAHFARAQITAIECDLKLPSSELLHVLSEIYECDFYEFIELKYKYEHALRAKPGTKHWFGGRATRLYLGYHPTRKKRFVPYTYYGTRRKNKYQDRVLIDKTKIFGDKKAFQNWQFVTLKNDHYPKALAKAIRYHREDIYSDLTVMLFKSRDSDISDGLVDGAKFLATLRLPYLLGLSKDVLPLAKLLTRDESKTKELNFYKRKIKKPDNFDCFYLDLFHRIITSGPFKVDEDISKLILALANQILQGLESYSVQLFHEIEQESDQITDFEMDALRQQIKQQEQQRRIEHYELLKKRLKNAKPVPFESYTAEDEPEEEVFDEVDDVQIDDADEEKNLMDFLLGEQTPEDKESENDFVDILPKQKNKRKRTKSSLKKSIQKVKPNVNVMLPENITTDEGRDFLIRVKRFNLPKNLTINVVVHIEPS